MYTVELQGQRFTLARKFPQLSALSDDYSALLPFYDQVDAKLVAGTWTYEYRWQADAARLRAMDRKRAQLCASRRKAIREFSKRSRFRLLSLAHSLDQSSYGVMLTLTYRSLMTDHAASKHHLELMLLYLKRRYSQCALLWRMEYQQRGAIHYHVMLLSRQSVWIDIATARQRWRDITGEDANPNVRWIDNGKRALAYVSKYVAKTAQADALKLDTLPYSDKDNPQTFVGRFWGIVNRPALPLAELTRYAIPERAFSEIVELTRFSASLARSKSFRLRKHKRLSCFLRDMSRRIKRSGLGFTLFCNAGDVKRFIERYTTIPNFA